MNQLIQQISDRQARILVLIAGALLPLAFSPFDFIPLSIISPAILFVLWSQASTRQAFWRGYFFGLGMFGVGASWVYVSIHDYGNTYLAVAVFVTAGFIAFLALFPALLGYGLARLYPNNKIRLLLAIPAGWSLFEWIRGWILSGFPWLHLAYAQTDSPLGGYATVAGVYGTGLVVAFCAVLLAAVVIYSGRVRVLSALVFVLLFVVGGLFKQVAWTQSYGDPIKVSLIQGNVSQHIKWKRSERWKQLDLYRTLTQQLWDSDLVIWPETAVPAFYHQLKDSYFAALGKEARAHKTDIMVGLPLVDQSTQQYYNGVVSVGSKISFYKKQHLVPFGEYVPLESLLRGLIGFFNLPMSSFSAGGSDQPLIEVAGQKVGTSICYEDAFGELVIQALPEATLLVNVSNDAWFGTSIAPHQHLQMARMRALESGRPLLRATNTGVTAIIDEQGALQAVAPQFRQYILSGRVQPMSGATPYVMTGNLPVVLIILSMLIVAFMIGRRTL